MLPKMTMTEVLQMVRFVNVRAVVLTRIFASGSHKSSAAAAATDAAKDKKKKKKKRTTASPSSSSSSSSSMEDPGVVKVVDRDCPLYSRFVAGGVTKLDVDGDQAALVAPKNAETTAVQAASSSASVVVPVQTEVSHATLLAVGGSV
jgi:hypothetical protein